VNRSEIAFLFEQGRREGATEGKEIVSILFAVKPAI